MKRTRYDKQRKKSKSPDIITGKELYNMDLSDLPMERTRYTEKLKTPERQSLYNYLREHGSTKLSAVKQAAEQGDVIAAPGSVPELLRKMLNDGYLWQPKFGFYALRPEYL